MIKELAISLAIGVVSVLFLFGFLHWIYFIIKKVWPYPFSSIKYGIFKKKYNEKDVQWCLDAINQGRNEIEIKGYLLIKGKPKKRVNEILYIFNQCLKKLKGGKKNE